ncbi:nicotinate-nucleotide diphosphorylase (carboxylating) [Halolactibacillus alkaliphilus]|uniref:Probable nicotinate-nucleotide pyrophosphorylase [carboxylating] n=1 Tax=Halolactibacillus alkaliphilus TaxID=442899 RepID=A0A511X4V3_9BACI|nr:carboxylating nicotinate-nucleotide diphosphorylase [Halolactibacillus alkaliphilus]GEN57935.1 nicotinate-nucleotide diphosphorylase (carboxylating) [Halolactibacillus alkaliphilus]GGN75875.1 nicotinate-nucleotide diphosphorylase (carboxylating) [Halolactibacillus alkaliphilus]SFP09040.1 nicotinate-nucleotide pyrophosphorylase [carboxylating] [Halolactibacillus alkaliphilus]
MNPLLLEDQLKQFFNEDIGHDDVSSRIIPENKQGYGTFLAKDSGIFCGREVIETSYQLFHEPVQITWYKADGDRCQKGEVICGVVASYQLLLKTERVILNLIQHLSGIATMTAKAISKLGHAPVKLVDTRKTTPGLRMLEKYAVTCGGGYNHRYALYDAVMLKENHLACFDSITEAVKRSRQVISHLTKIEVEIETLEQLREAIEVGVDVIMFDNLSPDVISTWIKDVPSTIVTEASGNITLDNIATYRDCGVDFISMGALTHSTDALDISLLIKGES